MRTPDDPRVQLLAELADETRYAVLERLEQGPASASELGELLHVTPTRLANHLRRLREGGLVTVSHHGRLAIYQLAEPGLREIFSMLNGLRGPAPVTGGRVPIGATCYDHLAGWLGVELMDHLVQSGALLARDGEGELGLGPAAAGVFTELGVDLPATRPRRMLAFSCMDGHAGRPHLGGQLGAQLAASVRQRGWVEPAGRPRRLRMTPAGHAALHRLGIQPPATADPAELWARRARLAVRGEPVALPAWPCGRAARPCGRAAWPRPTPAARPCGRAAWPCGRAAWPRPTPAARLMAFRTYNLKR